MPAAKRRTASDAGAKLARSGDAELLPELFRMNVGNFFVQLASERDRPRVLALLGKHATGDRRIFVGVIDPIDPRVETAEEVRDRVLEAAKFIAPAHLGTTDDCGFSPFGDDTSTSRDTAFAKVRSRVLGTEMASKVLGVCRPSGLFVAAPQPVAPCPRGGVVPSRPGFVSVGRAAARAAPKAQGTTVTRSRSHYFGVQPLLGV